MVEVTIDSIRVSLTTQHRVVILKDINSERYLPIWIGQFEAEAITVELQEIPPQRPFTHDLIKSVIRELGGKVVHIMVNELRNDVFYAKLVVDVDGRQIEIDSRPSDAIAVAIRTKSPIFIADSVMSRAGIEMEEDIEEHIVSETGKRQAGSEVDERRLSAFSDFVNSLDLDDLDSEEDN